MEKVIIPYRITRRLAVASSNDMTNPEVSAANLCSEVGSYGGSCISSITFYTSGTAVICPNTPQQRTADVQSPYTIAFPVPCPPGTNTPGTYVPPPPSVYTGSGVCIGGNCYSGGGGGNGGGGVPGGSPTPIKTDNPCDCKPDGTACPDDGDPTTCDVCKGGSCTHLPKDQCYCVGKDDGTPCDDNNKCTSYDGEHIANDYCKGGTCVGKEIEDKEGPSVTIQTPEAFNLIGKVAGVLNSLCSVIPIVDAPDIGVSGTSQSITRCCKNETSYENVFKSGSQMSINVTATFATKGDTKTLAEFPIPAFPAVLVIITGKVSAEGSGKIKTDDNPCHEECSGSTQIDATVSGTIGAGLALLSKDLLSVTGNATVSGGGEFTIKCTGEPQGKFCVGKTVLDIIVLGFGFLKFDYPYKITDGYCF
jgi:hypothetical protein